MARLDLLANRLLVQGSRYVRGISRHTVSGHSIVARRVLSDLQLVGLLRIGELAARQRVTQPAMTTTVQKLADAGFVTRTTDPQDARASLMAVTPAGIAELDAYRASAAAVAAPRLATLTTDELDTLERATDLFEALVTSLEQSHAEEHA